MEKSLVCRKSKRVVYVCLQKKMPLGFFGVHANDVAEKVAEGFTLLCSGLDISFMTAAAQDTLARLREGERA